MSIVHMSTSMALIPESLSSRKALLPSSFPAISVVFLPAKLPTFSLTPSAPFKTTPIRMGGGPRTYPGGVSKWQWKRMQAKKEKQLLKARLTRERQIYEMRKRAELKAAVSELERPWEAVEKPPNLFSTSADEQLKLLADRFQKAGGLDLWSERDGPELFRPDTGLPSSRFFPKGVVHSIKPYRKIAGASENGLGSRNSAEHKNPERNPGNHSGGRNLGVTKGIENGNHNGKLREKENMRRHSSDSERYNSMRYSRNNEANQLRGETNQEL